MFSYAFRCEKIGVENCSCVISVTQFGHRLLLLRDIWPYVILFTNVCIIVTGTVVYLLFTVKEFLPFYDNIITVAMAMMLKKPFHFHILYMEKLH
jgi:hypothetical protein